MSEIIPSRIIPSKSRERVWRELIAEQGRSGRSIRTFCQEKQINANTFQYWKRKFKNLRPASLANKFVSLSSELSSLKAMRNHSSAESSRIHLPNGVRIELGAGLESEAVSGLIRSLCGVGMEGCAKS